MAPLEFNLTGSDYAKAGTIRNAIRQHVAKENSRALNRPATALPAASPKGN